MGMETVIRRNYGIIGDRKQAEILLNNLVSRVGKKMTGENFFMLDVNGHNVDIRPFLANAVSLFAGVNYDKIIEFTLRGMSDVEVAGLKLPEIISRDEARLLSIGLTWPLDFHRRLVLFTALKKCRKAAVHITACALGYLGFNNMQVMDFISKVGAKEFNMVLVVWWLHRRNLKEGKEKLIPYVIKLGRTLNETLEYCDKEMSAVWMRYLSGESDLETFLDELDNIYRQRNGVETTGKVERFLREFVAGEIWQTYVDDRSIISSKKSGTERLDEPRLMIEFISDILESLVVVEAGRVKNIFMDYRFTADKVTKIDEEHMKLSSKVRELEEELFKMRKEISKVRKEAEEAVAQLNKVKKENDELRENNSQLKKQLENAVEPVKTEYEVVINSLKADVNRLTNELAIANKKSDDYYNELIDLRNELSKKKAELEDLKESYEDLKEMKLSNAVHVDFSIPFDVIVNSIKDLRIVVVGGSQTLATSLRAVGLNKLKFFDADGVPSVNEIGICDCIVIIVTYVPHSGIKNIRKYGKRMGIPVVNFNGRNVEDMCRAIYKEVYDGE